MLYGIHIRSKRILRREAWGNGTVVIRATVKRHLMDAPPRHRKTGGRASKTLCGIKIPWKVFAQRKIMPEEANCKRCLNIATSKSAGDLTRT